MGLEFARAWVSVRGDVTQLPADLSTVNNVVTDSLRNARRAAEGLTTDASNAIQNSMRSVRGAADDAAEAVRRALRDTQTYAAGFLTKWAFSIDGFVGSGRSMRDELELTKVSFETMLGSAEEMESVMARLTRFAIKTPFTGPQLESVTKQLIMAGDRGDELFKTLQMMGDVAGADVEKFNTLGIVYNQIRSAGGVASSRSQDFRQLSSRNMIQVKDIADHFNIDMEKAAQMRLSFEDIKAILFGLTQEGGRFHNMMEKQSQSIRGLQSTYEDAVGIMGRSMMGALTAWDRGWLNFKIAAVGVLDEFITSTDGAAAASLVTASAVGKLTAAVFALRVASKALGVTFSTWTKGAAIASGVLAIAAAIGAVGYEVTKTTGFTEAWGPLLDSLKTAWGNVTLAAGTLFDAIMSSGVNDVIEETGSIVGWLAGKFGAFAVSASEWMIYLADVIRWMVDNAGTLWDIHTNRVQMGLLAIGTGVWDTMNSMISGLAGMFGGLKTLVVSVFEEILGIMEKTAEYMGAATEASLQAGKRFVLTGSLAEAGKEFKKTFLNEIQVINDISLENPIRKAMEAYAQTKAEMQAKLETSPFEADRLLAQQEIARLEGLLTDMERTLPPEKAPEEKEEAPKEGGATDKKEKPEAVVKAGIFEVAGFNDMFQRAAIEGENKQARMVGLLETLNITQTQALDALKNNKPGMTE